VLGWFNHFLASGLAVPLQLLTLGLIAAAVFVNVTLPELPDVEKGLRNVEFEQPLRVYSADGALMAQFGVERRQPVKYAELPPLLVQAFLATEDSRFFEHGGIDATGMARALLSYASTGIKAQGGSTITMQLTRNFFLSPEKTFQRKLAEILLALRVEKTLTKEDILELYLNEIFFGHRAYGVAAAAATYYDKPLSRLNVSEMAMLAGLPKAPSTNNPITNPERALERRNYILGRMLELGFIDESVHEIAVLTPDMARMHGEAVELDAGYVAEMARQEINEHYGEEALKRGLSVVTTIESWMQVAAQDALRKTLRQYDRRHGYRGPEAQVDLTGASEADMDAYLETIASAPDLTAGLVTAIEDGEARVYMGGGRETSLDLSQVRWARAFRNANWRGPQPRQVSDVLAVGDLIRLRRDSNDLWELSAIPGVGGALVALAPRDGAVRALVGGYGFNVSEYNRALDMKRQPGSSFKPFVYAAALNEGWTPVSNLRDQSVRRKGAAGEIWEPKNADHKEMGAISMRKALMLSRNLATINLLDSVGIDKARDYIRRFGFPDEAMPPYLSMALGTGETSLVKMAEGYAVFANGGYHVLPYFISRIDESDGQPVYQANPPRACSDCWFRTGKDAPARTEGTAVTDLASRAIDPRIAFQVTSMMEDVVRRGTGTRAKRLGRSDIVGKTGTTNDVRDSWFCGFQADVVAVAWMGFDGFEKLGRGEEGGRAALSMWNEFMETALKDKPKATLDPPPGMVAVKGSYGREYVMEEFKDALQGPAPVAVASTAPKRRAKPAARPKTTAPKAIDDLF
jgi:penicillin-binding protein 1A